MMSEHEPTYEELRVEAWDTMNHLIEANKNNRETVSQEAILHLGMFFADTSPMPSRNQLQAISDVLHIHNKIEKATHKTIEERLDAVLAKVRVMEGTHQEDIQALVTAKSLLTRYFAAGITVLRNGEQEAERNEE